MFIHFFGWVDGLRRADKQDTLSQLRASKAFRDDRHRFLTLHYTKTHNVLGFQPFDFLEDKERRNTLELLGSADNPFKTEMLSAKGLKKAVVEIYHATKTTFARELANEVASSPIRILHLSIDLWTVEASAHRDKYMGLRVFLLTQEFQVKTYLLAVKQYKPAADCTTVRAGKLVQLWAGHVLKEFGLDWRMVAGAVTDSNSGAKFAFSDIPGVMQEWCILHLLNRAIVDTFSLSPSPSKSNNLSARKVVAEVQRIVEQRSNTVKEALHDTQEEGKYGDLPKAVLRQAVPHRWVSLTVLLERIIFSSDNLVSHYGDGLPGMNSKKEEVQEIYSLLKSVALIIQGGQSSKTISSLTSVQRMILLLSTDLNVKKSLLLHDPLHYLTAQQPVTRGEEPPAKAERVRRDHAELSDAGKEMRAKMYDTVYRRFGRKRWGQGYRNESHLFDMMLALNPSCRSLGYIDKLSEAKNTVDLIKGKVWAQLESLVEEVIVVERAAASALKAAHGPQGQEQFQKRVKFTPTWDKDQLDAMASSGMFDTPIGNSVGEEEDTESDTELSPREEASHVIRAWREARIPSQYRVINDGEGLGIFWQAYGRHKFRVLSKVARSVLGAPASGAVLERDFGEPRELITQQHKCGPLGPAYAEMAMFLHGVYDHIPEAIPKLSDGQAKEAIPFRLRDPAVQRELAELFVVPPLANGEETSCGVMFADSDDERAHDMENHEASHAQEDDSSLR
ncbi:unnamed protein product [Discosporangium mesarthrocarpum]